jgi:hypothetical protein
MGSDSPSQVPTDAPTSPAPTQEPTFVDPYPFNEPPRNPDRWYFNYDTRPGAKYGPGTPGFTPRNGGFDVTFMNNAWSNVANPPGFYWNEFTNQGYGPWKDTLSVHSPAKNRCHRIGFQSPIDVRVNNKKKCEEHHEVRSLVSHLQIRQKAETISSTVYG